MNSQEPSPSTAEYRCPGQQHSISRAVHLGRLAAFYPACRRCPHRDDTGTLSPRQVEQLQEVQSSNKPESLFHGEGAGGVYLNDLTPAAARQIAAAFGIVMQQGNAERSVQRASEGDQCKVVNDVLTVAKPVDGNVLAIDHSVLSTDHFSPPSIIVAGDGRSITAELTAAVSEGIRWSGCNVIDIGSATAACLAFAVHGLRCAGGILVGNYGQQPHIVGLQFWANGPRPLSAGGSFEPVIAAYQSGVDRPVRRFGTLRRAATAAAYLAALAEYYHALRPLRVVVNSTSRPLVEYLEKLTATVACEVIPCRVASQELSEQVRSDGAHFGVCVDGDGETCRVLDEHGRKVSAERLLLLLAADYRKRNVAGPAGNLSHWPDSRCLGTSHGCPQGELPTVCVVMENGISLPVMQRLERQGADVVMSNPRRADMATAMRKHKAVLGGGLSGRFWFDVAGLPLPDALMAVTQLLVLLSRSDAPFSVVLDRDAPLG